MKCFEDVFKNYIKLIRYMSSEKSKESGIPKEEFESFLCEALWNAFITFDPTKGCSLNTWITRILKQAALKLLTKSKERTYRRKVVLTLDKDQQDDGEVIVKEVVDDRTPDYYLAHKECKKKEADQLWLIDSLLESTQIHSDPKMTAIIKGLPGYKSTNDAATSNGLTYNQVDRPLRRMARNYRREIHGDIVDYFPDEVEVKREFLMA